MPHIAGRLSGLIFAILRADFWLGRRRRLKNGGVLLRSFHSLTLTRAHRSAEALLFIWILSAGSRGEAVAVMGWGGGHAMWLARQSEGFSRQSHFSLRWFSLWFFCPCLTVRVSSDCAPRCRCLSSGWCHPQPSRQFCLARAPPSGSPGEQQDRAQSVSIAPLGNVLFFKISLATLTLSSPVPHSVIWVCLQPFPPVRPHTAGLCCFPFFTNTCSMPTWWPASLCRNDRHRLPSFQGGASGRTSWAPRPVLLLPTSGMVRYRPPVVPKITMNYRKKYPPSNSLRFSEGSSEPYSPKLMQSLWWLMGHEYVFPWLHHQYFRKLHWDFELIFRKTTPPPNISLCPTSDDEFC